ncbi:hypothetical protein GUJ93_ZPchr0681g6578, partial [Zizania palustris]
MKSSDIDRFFDAFAFDFALLNGCGVGRGAPATTTAGSSSAHHQNLSATYQRYVVTAAVSISDMEICLDMPRYAY